MNKYGVRIRKPQPVRVDGEAGDSSSRAEATSKAEATDLRLPHFPQVSVTVLLHPVPSFVSNRESMHVDVSSEPIGSERETMSPTVEAMVTLRNSGEGNVENTSTDNPSSPRFADKSDPPNPQAQEADEVDNPTLAEMTRELKGQGSRSDDDVLGENRRELISREDFDRIMDEGLQPDSDVVPPETCPERRLRGPPRRLLRSPPLRRKSRNLLGGRREEWRPLKRMPLILRKRLWWRMSETMSLTSSKMKKLWRKQGLATRRRSRLDRMFLMFQSHEYLFTPFRMPADGSTSFFGVLLLNMCSLMKPWNALMSLNFSRAPGFSPQ